MSKKQDITLRGIFSERLLHVPDYQRPYAWTRKQLGDFWDDLDLLGDGHHYTGTIVLLPRVDGSTPASSIDDLGTRLEHADVVDGQQRLTTCLILADRLAKRLATFTGSSVAVALAQDLNATFGLAVIEGVEVPRLQLAPGLADLWVDHLLGGASIGQSHLDAGQRRLLGAAAYFEEQLTDLLDGVAPDTAVSRLKDLKQRLTSGLRFLVYEVESSADVGVIFETLNDRGRPLTELEKTKNYLLYLARLLPTAQAEDLAATINGRWSDMFRDLAALDDGQQDQLLRWHWLASMDPDSRNWSGVASIKAHFSRARYVSQSSRLIPEPAQDDAQLQDGGAKLRADVERYVHELRASALYLREFGTDAAEYLDYGAERGRIRAAAASLRRTGVTAIHMPMLLACRLAHPSDVESYESILRVCERYSARVFVIQQKRANAGQGRLYSLAHQLRHGLDPDTVVSYVIGRMWRYASDAMLIETLSSLEEDWYHRRGHKYVLYEYELAQLNSGETLPTYAEFTAEGKAARTTEHILPQTPADDADCWNDKFTAEQRLRLTHSLGNLVLTLDNSAYGRKCFSAKRGEPLGPGQGQSTCYAQGKLHQERMLAAYEDWTPESIAARQDVLASWILGRWAVPTPAWDQREKESVSDEIETEPANLES